MTRVVRGIQALAKRSLGRHSGCTFRRFSSLLADSDDGEEAPVPLVRMQQARIGYSSTSKLHPVDLTIQYASNGGHALLGRNGAGKSLVAQSLLEAESTGIQVAPDMIEHVSFESHLALLEAGGSVYQALAQGNLNKAAQFLVVRFGLYPLLHQDVQTLSNGQIKKVLIVRALSLRPPLLILDNAFDGLDVPSRDVLKQLVSKTLRGFSSDILVQAVSAKNTAHTQVLLLTQRAEEIVDEISFMSYFDDQNRMITIHRDDRTATDLLNLSLGLQECASCAPEQLALPSPDAVQRWWNKDRVKTSPTTLAVDMKQVSVKRNGNTLLHNVDWQVEQGQRWLVGGLNGAGKSTLSRLLARREKDAEGHVSVLGKEPGKPRSHVGWVSTELHMSLAKSDRSVQEILTMHHEADTSDDSWQTVAQWLGVDSLLDQSFPKLSQGQQRLVLIASALASGPSLLILDEPCQGLDLVNREGVLELVEQICASTNMGLIYITHHLEEKLPSITHALHLTDGQVVFQGEYELYAPEKLD